MRPIPCASIFPQPSERKLRALCSPAERDPAAGRFLARAFRSNAMKPFHFLAVSGLALSAFLIAATADAQQNSYPTSPTDRVDANGMPTTHSTPTEQAQTQSLNEAEATAPDQSTAPADNSADAQYQQQQQQY